MDEQVSPLGIQHISVLNFICGLIYFFLMYMFHIWLFTVLQHTVIQ